jgi:hypothetical protein
VWAGLQDALDVIRAWGFRFNRSLSVQRKMAIVI